MFVTGWGLTGSAQAVADQYAGDIRLGVLPAHRQLRGLLAHHAVEILIVTGSFACAMAFYNTGARYLFSLGREGMLPRARPTHPTHRGPVIASMTVTVIVALYARRS